MLSLLSGVSFGDGFFTRLEAVKLDQAGLDAGGQTVLASGDIGKKTVCLRPMRKGVPYIHSEKVKDQVRVHLYGHGGSGWTLLWGSVDKAMDQFQELAKTSGIKKTTPITVIGRGCMGMASALTLHQAGYKNVQIVAERDPNIASLNSTGYLAMVSLATETPEEREEMEKVAIRTLEHYKKIDEGTHPIINEGVHLIDVYSGLGKKGDDGPLETTTGIEPYAEAGMLPQPEDGVVEFSTGVRYPMRRFKTYFMNTVVLMKAFERELETRNIPIIEKTVHSFEEIKTPVVFNCSGIGARQLNHDDKVYPNLGLLLELENQPTDKLDYIIYTRYQPAGAPLRNSPKDKADIYFMPRSGGLLGATFIDQNDGRDSALNEQLFKRILTENKAFFGY